ncbi:MAG: chlorite dismutase family protein [Planctomycetes bacterium]|nr:chlorite dismutase family protein [Planctomycetota bacterium]
MERRPPPEKPDIREKGAARDGQPQVSERRLFMQLLVFTGCTDTASLPMFARSWPNPCVLYADLNDPHGVALLTMSEDPAFFINTLRPALNELPFSKLMLKPELTMFGRTYSLGYEPDLQETLFARPKKTALNREWPWAVWYPLRRRGSFARLPAEEQKAILGEHGTIGRAFGEADYAHDIRLACHGLDTHDNDFVIGLTGRDLHPLSAIVQAMRTTRQTSEYLESLGPFFVGRAVWQSPM